MSIIGKHIWAMIIALGFVSSTLRAQSPAPLTDNLQAEHTTSTALGSYPYINPLRTTLKCTLPLIAISTGYSLTSNKNVATARNEFFPKFKYRYDDYMQFAPMAIQLGLHLAGVEGRSQSTLELASGNLLSAGIMLSVVTLGKTLTHIERPDGSDYKSFPSGHTAMAFASATMLRLEYGERYPWLAAIGYGMASSVGIGRILNNKHWIGDVATGAFVGVLSAELGYWLNDRLWRRSKHYQAKDDSPLPSKDFLVSLPAHVGLRSDVLLQQTGLGFRWRYSERGYYAFANILLEIERPKKLPQEMFGDKDGVRAHNSSTELGWGKEWLLSGNWLSLDTGLSLSIDAMRKAYPSAHVSPRIYLNRRFAIRADLIYSYRKATYNIKINGIKRHYHLPQLVFGSAIEFRL